MTDETFPRELQEWRARLGLSYRRAAELLDVDHVTLHRWAHDNQDCSHPAGFRWAMRAIEYVMLPEGVEQSGLERPYMPPPGETRDMTPVERLERLEELNADLDGKLKRLARRW